MGRGCSIKAVKVVVVPFATNMGGIQEPMAFTQVIIVKLVLEFNVFPTTFLDPLSVFSLNDVRSCDLFRRNSKFDLLYY